MAFVKTLSGKSDIADIGQRALDLAVLKENRFAVPDSFVVLSGAFDALVEENNLKPKIEFLLSHASARSPQSFMNVYTSMRKAIEEAKLPRGMQAELKEFYDSLTAEGVGLSSADVPVRIIVSANNLGNPESNDTVIQNIRDWKEFLVAVKEAWALAYLPSQLQSRIRHAFNETRLKVALLVQVMNDPVVSTHAYSCLPEDRGKVYLQAYYGQLDLRDKVVKDYYAVTKNNLEVVASELRAQPAKLVHVGNELELVQRESKNKEDKLIKRDREELSRLAKKAENVLRSPVKVFFATKNEQHTLLWANRLGFDATEKTPVAEKPASLEVVDLDEPSEDVRETSQKAYEKTVGAGQRDTPEDRFAHAERAAAQAIKEAAAIAEQVQESMQVPSDPNVSLLKASLDLAMKTIERKYEQLRGQVGDDFHEMIRELNSAGSLSADADILAMAHDAVERNAPLSAQDSARAIREITKLLA